MTDEQISKKIEALGLDGFGGACFEAANVINKKVFGHKGLIVGAANTFWLDRRKSRFIGHVAVFFEGKYWDSDAEPKEWEEIESWGMLDPKDSDYVAHGWTEETAYAVTRLEGAAVGWAWDRSHE